MTRLSKIHAELEAEHKLANTIQPRGERIVVTRIPEKVGVIHLTDAPASRKFKVLAIGPDVYDVEVGDVVLLPGLAANEPDFAKDKEALVQQNDIGCIVEA